MKLNPNSNGASLYPGKRSNSDFGMKNTHDKLSIAINIFLWLLFFINATILAFNFGAQRVWKWETLLRVNGFTLLIWTTVTFFSAIISTYSLQYLAGFKHQKKFTSLSLAFTFSIMLFLASNHIALLLPSWFLMSVCISCLIGIDNKWGEAQEARKFAQKYFLLGTLFLTGGVLLLASKANSYTIDGILLSLPNLSQSTLILAAILIIIAAIIQSAIYPFHRWLLSAMTAPTPASALMHAGFVNGSGILLTLFAPLIFASNTFVILFFVGGITSIIAQFSKLLQVNVKQKLGCSTIAQMGFMIMQCGLGFFNAAIVHLILHGFYKAYLFLSAGETIKQSRPEKPEKIVIKPLQALAVLFYGLIGAWLFVTLTGKGTELNSGVFLTLIVAITVGQITYNIIKQNHLSMWQKAYIPPIMFLTGIVLYALIYNGVTGFMSTMPMIDTPLPLTLTQIVFGVIFLVGFFIMKLGIYRKLNWLYVRLMNDSQPYHKTILMFKSK